MAAKTIGRHSVKEPGYSSHAKQLVFLLVVPVARTRNRGWRQWPYAWDLSASRALCARRVEPIWRKS